MTKFLDCKIDKLYKNDIIDYIIQAVAKVTALLLNGGLAL